MLRSLRLKMEVTVGHLPHYLKVQTTQVAKKFGCPTHSKNDTQLLTDLCEIQLLEATAMTAHLSVVAQRSAQGNSCLKCCIPP